jgi:hypothetical protein
MRATRWRMALVAMAAGIVVYFVAMRDAQAIPSFARKYQTSCQTCHTVYPVLNPFGEAFRRNGYRFPSQNGSVDSDAEKAPAVPLGQEEYKKTFPDSVWPDKIVDAIPLSVMLNGSVPVNLPDSDAKTAAGNTFTWSGVVAEMHVFGAGSFNDNLTYMTQLTLESDFGSPPGSFDIETAYLLWNDVVGPRHWVNLWVGRLWAPQLTSFGLHSSYLNDTVMPGTSVVGLYNPSGSFVLGQGHTDGVELNGIVGHRFNYALGWVASSAAAGVGTPNAEDAYVHLGMKSGGVALDGEGKYGPNVPDPRKPWAEKSITLDLFAYHGLTRLDNGTGAVSAAGAATPVLQNDQFNAAGAVAHGQLDSLTIMVGAQIEKHDRPYQGGPNTASPALPGVPDFTNGTAILAYGEIDYVVFPWLVPGVRVEHSQVTFEGAGGVNLQRFIPGVATLVRPNVRLVVTGDIEHAFGVPPSGSWGGAGGVVAPSVPPAQQSKLQAETLNLTANVAF